VGRSDGERTGGFIGERAHGRTPVANARAAAAAMLSVPGSTPRVGTRQQQLPTRGAAAASCRNFFYLICKGGSGVIRPRK
jgi:hypothetical protein